MKLRPIVLATGTWRWGVGKGGTVVLHGPAGQKWVVYASTVLGSTPHVFERGQFKRTSDGMVTPSDIKRYLQQQGVQ